MAPEVHGKPLFAIGHCPKAGPGLRGKPQGLFKLQLAQDHANLNVYAEDWWKVSICLKKKTMVHNNDYYSDSQVAT